jgi:DNA-binding winged helix-turn-helix (wHTH) protein
MRVTDQESSHPADIISFGPFRLYAAQRLLEKAGSPLNLSARALDILIVLIERAGKVVSKKSLMARVWPDVSVDEGNLRFHIAALRRALKANQFKRCVLVSLRNSVEKRGSMFRLRRRTRQRIARHVRFR